MQRPNSNQREKKRDPAFVLFLSEETTQHSTAEIARKAAGRESSSRDIRSLTELVAARKGKGIRNSQHDGNNCTHISISNHTTYFSKSGLAEPHTNQTQPNKMQSENRNNPKHNPTDRLRIQRQPEKPLIRSIDISGF